MKRLIRTAGRVAHKAGRTLDRVGDAQHAVMARPGMNLAADPDEAYYGAQYMRWLGPLLNGQRLVVDVGCGSGRLTAPVARALPDAEIIGVDVSAGKVGHAREQTAGLENVRLLVGDARVQLADVGPADLALFTEVDFFEPESDAGLLEFVAGKVRPGGILFASFRSEWFNLAYSVRARDFVSAEIVRDRRDGELFGTAYRFRWYTPAEVIDRLEGLGFDVVVHAIGVLSGREGDALDVVARPGLLDEAGRQELLDLEVSLADRYVGCGRYILAVARKR